jgi:exodeoxyribonuclease V alpha subunit
MFPSCRPLIVSEQGKGFRLDAIPDLQILCPMNRGSIGVRELNQRLQRVLNPAKPEEQVVAKNNYENEVFNGDIGTIE